MCLEELNGKRCKFDKRRGYVYAGETTPNWFDVI
jgi:hypothetical protein